MARKRMIDPDFWTDEALGTLPVHGRLLFMGLISNADDEGRLRGNPALVRSSVFPYDDFTSNDVAELLNGLESAGLIRQYEVDGQSYIDIPNFLKHQTINKPTPSKLPPYKEGKTTTEPLPDNDGSPTVVLPPKLREEKLREEKLSLAPKPARERDVIWDALSETVGEPATKGNRSNFGRVVQELKSANATPEQILRFPVWWRKRFPDAALTVNCYASKNHWGEFINSPPAPPPNIDDIKDPFMRALLRDAERTEASNGQREHLDDETWRDEIRLAESWQLGPGGGPDG